MGAQTLATRFLGTWLALAAAAPALGFGGAPLPLDPKLSAIAPEKCLWYGAYAGQGSADPKSANHTERLFAEPQVQRFITEVKTQLTVGLRRAAGDERQKQVLADQLPELFMTAIGCPMAMYVETVRPRDKGADVDAAFVLNAGEQREKIESMIAELLKLIPPGAPPLVRESVAGVDWQRVQTPPEAPAVRFGWQDNYLILAVGESTPGKLIERMNGAAPKWLADIRSEHPIQRELSIGYLNIEGILAIARPFIEAEEPKAWPVIEKLGVTHLRALHGVSGLDQAGFSSEAHLVTDGQHVGLLGFVPHEPLSAGDLRPVPKDAMIAFAARMSAREVWDKALALAVQFDPQAEQKFLAELAKVESELGFKFRDDVIDALGDSKAAYLPGGDLMTSWINVALAVRVKDAEKLRSVHAKLIARAKAETAARNRPVEFDESVVDGQTIYSLRIPNQPMPISPSWCIGDDWFVVGLAPQSCRSALERQAEDSLGAEPGVSEALGRSNPPSILTYQNTPQLVRSVYPLLMIAFQTGAGQLRQQGVSLDATALPSQEVIIKHLRPAIGTITAIDDGFICASHGSVPGGGLLSMANPMVGGVGVALLLPAVQAAREAARRAEATNDTKQIMLSLLNYESAHGSYPAYANFDAAGKPLLSWRVHVLPYLEENELYQQFHLDEPWDSEHNKQLIAKMPRVFLDPSSTHALADGKSSFLGVKGEGCLFDGTAEGRKIMAITDGTSNTIAIVQVADGTAEIWTKPADWEFDEKNPTKGLGGLYRGGWVAGYCDGSVTMVDKDIDREAFGWLLSIAGGEVIRGGVIQENLR